MADSDDLPEPRRMPQQKLLAPPLPVYARDTPRVDVPSRSDKPGSPQMLHLGSGWPNSLPRHVAWEGGVWSRSYGRASPDVPSTAAKHIVVPDKRHSGDGAARESSSSPAVAALRVEGAALGLAEPPMRMAHQLSAPHPRHGTWPRESDTGEGRREWRHQFSRCMRSPSWPPPLASIRWVIAGLSTCASHADVCFQVLNWRYLKVARPTTLWPLVFWGR